METNTLDNTKMGKPMEKGCFIGKMEKYMMESGHKELKKDMVYGKVQTKTLI